MTSIPSGLTVSLSRGTVLPGASAEADRWMAMLNDRLDECVATLDRERMAIEIVFRLQEDGTDHLYWVTVQGADGAGLDLSVPIDRDHDAQARRTKHPGWTEATPQVLMLPDPVRRAVLDWALRPTAADLAVEPAAGLAASGPPPGAEFPVTATVEVASAGLHVMDRWTDAVVDALREAGATDPDLSGSLTGGRFEITFTTTAPDLTAASTTAAHLMSAALNDAAMPGLALRSLTTTVTPDAAAPISGT